MQSVLSAYSSTQAAVPVSSGMQNKHIPSRGSDPMK
jgi:hypothetical protein